MAVRISVFYDTSSGGKIDMDYLLSDHVALAQRLLEPHGLRGLEIGQGIAGGAPGEPAPYAVVAHQLWDSVEEFGAAFAKVGEELGADVAVFTDAETRIQVSEILLSRP